MSRWALELRRAANRLFRSKVVVLKSVELVLKLLNCPLVLSYKAAYMSLAIGSLALSLFCLCTVNYASMHEYLEVAA